MRANLSKAQLENADVELLRDFADIVVPATEAVGADRVIVYFLGEQGKELANCIVCFATHNVPYCLKAALLGSRQAIGYQRSILSFLENVAIENAAPLRQYIGYSDA